MNKAEVYVDGSYNRYIPEITRGGVTIVFDDVPYAMIKITTKRDIYVKQWNVGGELLSASFGINMTLVELDRLRDEEGIAIPKTITVVHDYKGIRSLVVPDVDTGKIWKTDKPGCLLYKEFYNEVIKRHETGVRFQWVPGHSGNKWNEVTDLLAKGVWPSIGDGCIRKEVDF